MFSKLWGRITGADKGKQFPEQQGSALGRVGNYVVVYPQGFYANAGKGTLFKEIAPGVVMPVTVDRPDGIAQGETTFFHPATGSRIVARNSGDLELKPADGGKVLVDSDLEVTGGTVLQAATVAGDLATEAAITNQGVDIGLDHAHSNGNNGDPTGGVIP